MKFVIVLAMLLIVACLGSACFFMLRKDRASAEEVDDEARSRSMFRALGWRIALSVVLFVSILLAAKLGYLHPAGLPLGQ